MAMACSIVLLAVSGFSLYGMLSQEWEDDALQDQLKDIFEGGAREENTAPEKDRNAEEDSMGSADAGNPDSGMDVSSLIHPGLAALHKENQDCFGWIRIEGTMIDYPVMHRPSEESYYLHRDFYGEYSANGSLFLSEACDPEISDNLVIYGHHMKSGKMFAALEKYKEPAFYEGHPEISFYTLYGKETYRIFSVFCTSVGAGDGFPYYTFIKARDMDEYREFIRDVKGLSLYDTGVTADYGDKLLTLSTCEYSQKNGRFVAVAKRIRQQG